MGHFKLESVGQHEPESVGHNQLEYVGQYAWILHDIKNTLLINGLQSLNVDADYYTLNTSNAVLSLMDLNNSPRLEEIHKGYFDLMKSTKDSGITDLETIAEKLYEYLLNES